MTTRKVQIHFDNDEVLTVETGSLSLADPVTGQQQHIPLQNVDAARTAIERYEKTRDSNAKHVGQENSHENPPA